MTQKTSPDPDPAEPAASDSAGEFETEAHPGHESTADAAADTGEAKGEETGTLHPAEEQLLRLRADFDNFRKRVQRDKAEWTRDATARVMDTLLPVLDHYRMGLENARNHEAKPEVLHGFEMVWQQLETALTQMELQMLGAPGDPFDPALHEALQVVPSEEAPADTILEVFRPGYRLGERLLRPAQVVVSGGTPQSDASEEEHVQDQA